MFIAFQIVHTFFYVYTALLVIAICLSWFPDWERYAVVRFIRALTDPYLRVFRKIIPPLGIIDLSPIVAFFFLRILESCIRAVMF